MKSSDLRNCCTVTKFRFRLKKDNYEFSKIQIDLYTNDTEIQVCANDDNLNTTHYGAMIQEVLVSCKTYDVETNSRKLRRLDRVG
jgi:hypothetical protein